ncbi:MAG: hypothetical protein ACKPJO_29600, partial [Dolichospermum sp.]
LKWSFQLPMGLPMFNSNIGGRFIYVITLMLPLPLSCKRRRRNVPDVSPATIVNPSEATAQVNIGLFPVKVIISVFVYKSQALISSILSSA